MSEEKVCKQCGTKLDWSNSTLCCKCGVPLCEDCALKNNYKCEKCSDKAKIVLPDVIRRSHIEDYKACPYYFKLEVIDGHEPSQHVLARLGSDLHELYEKVQKGVIGFDYDVLEHNSLKLIKEIMKDYPDEDEQKLIDKSKICNRNFIKVYPTLGKPISFEERIYFPIAKDLPKVTIAYDRLEIDLNGDLHIIDWKTGKILSGKKLTTDLQPALYLKAVESKYGKMPKSFKLIYLGDVDKDGNYKERVFTSLDGNKFVCKVGKKEYIQDVNEQIRTVQKLFSQMKRGHFSIPEKPDYFKCKMCSFKERGLCQGSDMESWKQINEERSKYGW